MRPLEYGDVPRCTNDTTPGANTLNPSRHFNKNEFEQAAQMALSATKTLIERDQVTASVEMGCLMIESYAEGKMEVSIERKADIKSIVDIFQLKKAQGPELASFLRAAVKYVTDHARPHTRRSRFIIF